MSYEKITGFVDLEKLENDSELMNVTGGTAKYKTHNNNCVPNLTRSWCIILTKAYKQCVKPELPPQD